MYWLVLAGVIALVFWMVGVCTGAVFCTGRSVHISQLPKRFTWRTDLRGTAEAIVVAEGNDADRRYVHSYGRIPDRFKIVKGKPVEVVEHGLVEA